MKKKIVFLLALSILLLSAITMNSTLAYFTTYVTARGGYTIPLGDTHIMEKFASWTKMVTITNDGQPVYVRAKAFAGDAYDLSYGGDGWILGDDGYYYYTTILGAGATTSELRIGIDNVPADAIPGDQFNVIVIYESTPLQYHEDGSLIDDYQEVDWNQTPEGGAEA